MKKIVAVLLYPNTPKNEVAELDEQTSKSDMASVEVVNDVQNAAHLQYSRDVDLDQENVLVKELQYLQGETRKTHHLNAFVVSQYNGWLAARQLQLKTCAKLQTIGETVQIV